MSQEKQGILEDGSSENESKDKLDVGKAKEKEKRIETFSITKHQIVSSTQEVEGNSFSQPCIFIERPLNARHFARP